MKTTTKTLVISAFMLGLSGAAFAQGAGGEGAGGGGTVGNATSPAHQGTNQLGGANDGSTGEGAPVRSGMGDGSNQGPGVGSTKHQMKSKHKHPAPKSPSSMQ